MVKATSVSTSALTNATRESRVGLQSKLAVAQKEATTGRLADVGETLGYLTERTVSLRQDVDRLSTFKDTNTIASARLSLTQTTLENVGSTAQQFLQTLVAARATPSSAGVAVSDAKAKLVSFTAALNTAQNGAYLFAGINTDVKPLTEYFPASAARTALADAFTAEFGLAQSAPGVEAISAADIQTFLDGNFATLFDHDNYTTTLSSASDQDISTRISNNERIETSTNANEEGFRKLASAYTLIADLGIEDLGSEAYLTVVDKAIALVGESIGDITQIQASLGTSEERIASANTRIDLQLNLVKEHINELEGVDPYEATSNVNALLTQIETAYSLTARLQNLSLVNFI
ncbi:MAG: flagellar hook-associated family protein [Hyphomicrobium sp.]|jgi:flagellar hook-associated protein 3 FlgL